MRAFPDERDLLRWEDDGGNPKATMSMEAVLRIVAMTDQVFAKCDALGVPLGEFYSALLEEQKASPIVSVPELYRRIFKRLGKE